MKLHKILLFVLCAALPAFAADDVFSGENFTYGFTVETVGVDNAEINAVRLPAHFYENVYSPNLYDVMVFNSADELVPFTIVRPRANSYVTPDGQALTIFPTFRKVKDKDKDTEREVIDSIVVDLREIEHQLSMLTFGFDEKSSFSDTIRIDYSSADLGSWRSGASANIAQLQSSGRSIISNTVDLSHLPAGIKYLRLTANTAENLLNIKSVDAEFIPLPIYSAPEKLTVKGVKNTDGHTVFNLEGKYPVEWVDFGIEPSYLFLGFELMGTYNAEDKEQWKNLFKRSGVSQYHYDKNVSGTAMHDYNFSSYALKSVQKLPESMEATFYWHPDILLFLPKGADTTYTVVYGSKYYKPDSSQSLADSRLRTLQDKAAPVLSSSEAFTIGDGTPPFRILDEESLTKRSAIFKYGLVGVIIIAVVLLSIASVRLLKDINKK